MAATDLPSSVASTRSAVPFRVLWTANATSNLGDGLYQFALPLLALATTQSPALISGVVVTHTLAWPLFGLHAGAIVDRFDRRTVLLAVSGLRLVILTALTAAILGGWLSLPVVYVAAAALGIGETLADTALTSLVPAVVEPDDLERANGRIVAGMTVTNTFLAPPVAGVLLSIGAALLTSVTTALYAITAAGLAILRRLPAVGPVNRTAGTPAAGVTAGLRFLWSHHLLRRLTLFTAGMNVWWAAFSALIVVYAVAPGPMGLDAAQFGVLFTAMAIGGLGGSMLAERLVARIGVRAALAIDFVGTALLVGVPALTTHPVAVGLAVAAAGAGSAVWIVLVASIRQRLTPDELLGRTYSASRLISWGVLPISAAAAGLAAEIVGIRVVFGVGAVIAVGLLVAFLALVPARDLEGRPG